MSMSGRGDETVLRRQIADLQAAIGKGGGGAEPQGINLHAMRVYAFQNTNLTTLQTNLNKFLQGLAVTNVETGTVAYAAGETRNRRYLGQEFSANGTNWAVLVFYAE